MSKEIKNYGRSVKTKLLTLSKESGIPYMTILVRYFQERLLYKVAHSDYKNNFLLKGGALLYAFGQEKARPTKDIDFLALLFDFHQGLVFLSADHLVDVFGNLLRKGRILSLEHIEACH